MIQNHLSHIALIQQEQSSRLVGEAHKNDFFEASDRPGRIFLPVSSFLKALNSSSTVRKKLEMAMLNASTYPRIGPATYILTNIFRDHKSGFS
jgi:hypothetical protein